MTGVLPCPQVSLHFQCVGLKNRDFIGKSDPFIVVYAQPKQTDLGKKTEFKEVWRSKSAPNTTDPAWGDCAVLDYHFEEVQKLRFEIYDKDDDSKKTKKHDFLGKLETTMSKIMGSQGGIFSDLLADKDGNKGGFGKIIVKGREISQIRHLLRFKFKAEKLKRKNFGGLGRSDPFYIILSEQEDGSFLRVFESKAIKSTTQPQWKKRKELLSKICNGDVNSNIKIEVWDFESSGEHKYIGSFLTTVDELMKKTSFVLEDEKNKTAGIFQVEICEIVERFSFLEYIQGGCDVRLSVAIDFTGSNNFADPPLHWIRDNLFLPNGEYNYAQLNEYQRALISVGNIVLDYDSDKMVKAAGFGAEIRNIEGCQGLDPFNFPLSLNPSKPELHGIKELMEAYEIAAATVNMAGPTNFASVINDAIRLADEAPANSYSILLILTDGAISDLVPTLDAIVSASHKALSIIIVGVGEADFSAMEFLDGDGRRLRNSQEVKAKRDMVQFVPFRKYSQMGYFKLAEETLREVPKQLETYFGKMNIKPTPPQYPQ